MDFNDLPSALKRRVDGNEIKLLSTLRTRWRGCEISLEGGQMLGNVDTATTKVPVV